MKNRSIGKLPSNLASVMLLSMAAAASGFILLFAPAVAAGQAAAMTPAPHSHPSAEAKQIPVPPPPMGWSSWNSFSNTVDAKVIMRQAKAMVTSGMQKAGYRTINIDEGW